VKGLGEDEGRRLALTGRLDPFADLEALVRRTRASEKELVALAEAGALESLGLSRRAALWEVRRLLRARKDALPLHAPEVLPDFTPLGPGETIAWDYRASYHSPRGHPLAPLRALLTAQGLPTAREVSAMRDGRPVRYAGLVICRQQPGTARGVTFMTLEDETGFVNLVIWSQVWEKYRIIGKTRSFLGVSGKIQSEDGVVHLIVDRLWRPALQREPVAVGARDFH